MKDFAKKHPVNKSKAKRVKTSLRAKRELNQPLKIKHLLIIAAMSALLLLTSNVILQNTSLANLGTSLLSSTSPFRNAPQHRTGLVMFSYYSGLHGTIS